MKITLSRVEEEIISFLRDKPGSSKADIVRHIRDNQLASRITVLDYLRDLENRDIIYTKKPKPNSQSFMMYLNESNKLATVIGELEEFKQAYTTLLQKSKDRLNNHDYSLDAAFIGDMPTTDPSTWKDSDKLRYLEFEDGILDRFRDLLDETTELDKKLGDLASNTQNYSKEEALQILTLLETHYGERRKLMNTYGNTLLHLISSPVQLFYVLTDLMFFRSVVRWPEQNISKGALSEMYSVIYSKITEIQFGLSEFIRSVNVNPLRPVDLLKMVRRFKINLWTHIADVYYAADMGLEIQKVIDSLRRINEDVKDLNLYDLDKVYVPFDVQLSKDDKDLEALLQRINEIS